ncbi:hypothetical protein HID58_041508, partial [Brassica napus]
YVVSQANGITQMDFPLHWMPNLQTVVREGMFAVVDDLKSGGGQTWRMERIEQEREASPRPDSKLGVLLAGCSVVAGGSDMRAKADLRSLEPEVVPAEVGPKRSLKVRVGVISPLWTFCGYVPGLFGVSPRVSVFDGSNLDAGVDFPLHWMPNLQTVVREGMFAVVDGMDLPVRLTDLKSGGGQTWRMERIEQEREASPVDACPLKLCRNIFGRVDSHLHWSPD